MLLSHKGKLLGPKKEHHVMLLRKKGEKDEKKEHRVWGGGEEVETNFVAPAPRAEMPAVPVPPPPSEATGGKSAALAIPPPTKGGGTKEGFLWATAPLSGDDGASESGSTGFALAASSPFPSFPTSRGASRVAGEAEGQLLRPEMAPAEADMRVFFWPFYTFTLPSSPPILPELGGARRKGQPSYAANDTASRGEAGGQSL